MLMRGKARRLLCSLLAFCITLNTNSVFARRLSEIPVAEMDGPFFDGLHRFETQTRDEIELENELNRALAELGGSPLEKISNHGDPLQVIRFYHAGYIQAREMMWKSYEELGEERFRQLLNEDKIYFDIPDVGRVEFSEVHGYPVGRVVHHPSGVKLVFIEPVIRKDSKDYELLINRLLVNSGRNRPFYEFKTPDGKRHRIPLGRDILIIRVSGDEIAENGVEVHARPTNFKERMRIWWRAMYQAPTWYTTRVGIMSATAQTLSASIIAGVFVWGAQAIGGMDVSVGGSPTAVAALSLTMSLGLGVFTRFYHNWRTNTVGEENLRRRDEVANTVMFFSIKAVSPNGLVQMFDILNPVPTLFNWLQFYVQRKLGAMTKQPAHRIADIKAQVREDQGWLKIPIPKITRDENGRFRVTKVNWPLLKETDWNRQFKYYLPRNALTQADRIWFTWMMAQYLEGNTEWYMPWLSTLGLAMTIPVMWKITKTWAQRNYPNTLVLEQLEEDAGKYLNPTRTLLWAIESIPFVGRKWAEGLEITLDRLRLNLAALRAFASPMLNPFAVKTREPVESAFVCEQMLTNQYPSP